MARGMNKVMLIGRVGEEPKVTALQNGTVANFSFATSDSYIDAQGNKQEKTEWHRLTAWGKTAEIVQKYIHKGDCLYVEGKIQYREYEKKEIMHLFRITYTTEHRQSHSRLITHLCRTHSHSRLMVPL